MRHGGMWGDVVTVNWWIEALLVTSVALGNVFFPTLRLFAIVARSTDRQKRRRITELTRGSHLNVHYLIPRLTESDPSPNLVSRWT